MNINFSQAFELDKLMLKGIVLQTSATEREERLKHLLLQVKPVSSPKNILFNIHVECYGGLSSGTVKLVQSNI
jgi:hypothetical protein